MKSLNRVIGAVLAAGLLAPLSAQALTLTADCNAGKTIAQALTQGDARKPLVLVVKGTCNESVRVVRDDVTLQGDAVADGIQVQDSHGAAILNTVIQQTAGDGMRIFVGDADVTGCTVQSSAFDVGNLLGGTNCSGF